MKKQMDLELSEQDKQSIWETYKNRTKFLVNDDDIT